MLLWNLLLLLLLLLLSPAAWDSMGKLAGHGPWALSPRALAMASQPAQGPGGLAGNWIFFVFF